MSEREPKRRRFDTRLLPSTEAAIKGVGAVIVLSVVAGVATGSKIFENKEQKTSVASTPNCTEYSLNLKRGEAKDLLLTENEVIMPDLKRYGYGRAFTFPQNEEGSDLLPNDFVTVKNKNSATTNYSTDKHSTNQLFNSTSENGVNTRQLKSDVEVSFYPGGLERPKTNIELLDYADTKIEIRNGYDTTLNTSPGTHTGEVQVDAQICRK